MSSHPVAGHCVMGCGETLSLGPDGHIRCAQLTCPRPTAVDELLSDPETEHVVELGETAFILRHPLRERLDDELMGCDLHARIAHGGSWLPRPGRYRLPRGASGGWLWEPVPAPKPVAHA